MAWDAENRMVDYCAGVGTGCGDTTAGAVRYAYDGDGHRTKTVIGGLTTTYVYDAFDNLAAEYGAQGATTGLQFSVQDHLGTTRAVMDASGAVLERVDYHPFGAEIPAESGSWRTQIAGYGLSTPTTRLRFTGKERDAESGNDYFGARYYASSMGRFMSPDPKQPSMKHLMNPQKWNKYAYVLNNPLSLVDPDGLEEMTIVYRTFIAPATLNFLGTRYAGDNRGFSSTPNASSRSSITVRIETDPSIRPGNPIIRQTSSAGQSRTVEANGNTMTSATQTQGLPTATGTRDANGNAVIGISQDVKNPLSPGPQSLTPGITANLSMNFTQNGSSVTTTGTASNFPSQELNVSGAGGTTTPVFQFTPSPQSNPFSLFLQDRKVNCTTTGEGSSCH